MVEQLNVCFVSRIHSCFQHSRKWLLTLSIIFCSILSNAQEAPSFKNPVLIYGTSFGNYFQVLYRQAKYDEMIRFTSSKSITKFGYNYILAYYQHVQFGFKIKLKSRNVKGEITLLNYDATINATTCLFRIEVVLENDSCKLLLSDNFYSHKYFCVE